MTRACSSPPLRRSHSFGEKGTPRGGDSPHVGVPSGPRSVVTEGAIPPILHLPLREKGAHEPRPTEGTVGNTGHTGHTDTRITRTNLTSTPHSQPDPQTRTYAQPRDVPGAETEPAELTSTPKVLIPVKRHWGEPGHTHTGTVLENSREPVPVKRHRGEPGHTRDLLYRYVLGPVEVARCASGVSLHARHSLEARPNWLDPRVAGWWRYCQIVKSPPLRTKIPMSFVLNEHGAGMGAGQQDILIISHTRFTK